MSKSGTMHEGTRRLRISMQCSVCVSQHSNHIDNLQQTEPACRTTSCTSNAVLCCAWGPQEGIRCNKHCSWHHATTAVGACTQGLIIFTTDAARACTQVCCWHYDHMHGHTCSTYAGGLVGASPAHSCCYGCRPKCHLLSQAYIRQAQVQPCTGHCPTAPVALAWS